MEQVQTALHLGLLAFFCALSILKALQKMGLQKWYAFLWEKTVFAWQRPCEFCWHFWLSLGVSLAMYPGAPVVAVAGAFCASGIAVFADSIFWDVATEVLKYLKTRDRDNKLAQFMGERSPKA